jgi:hypothetical protein
VRAQTSCEGTVKEKKLFSPANGELRAFVVDELLELEQCASVSLASISQRLDGPSEHQQWVADALSGASLAGREVPKQLAADDAEAPKPKPKGPRKSKKENDVAGAAAQPPKPKGKKRARAEPVEPEAPEEEEADAEEDCEVVD